MTNKQNKYNLTLVYCFLSKIKNHAVVFCFKKKSKIFLDFCKNHLNVIF